MMTKSITVFLLITLVLLDEKVISAEKAGTNSVNNDTTDGELGSHEELFLFFLFSFFALCVSLFGSLMLYVSYLDDRIMQLYSDEGNLIEGEVVATEFTRGVSANVEKMRDRSNQKEYYVSIEYTIFLSENYPVRIRKQLRVLESDLLNPRQHSPGHDKSNSCPYRYTSEGNAVTHKPNRMIEFIASRDSFSKSFQFDHGRKLRLLVLPDRHLSALPACQVERRLGIRYRMFSITFVLAAILIAVFCFRLAVPLLLQETTEGGTQGSGYILAVIGGSTKLDCFLTNFLFAIFSLAPLPCIHQLLHDLIQYSLEGEYYEMGGEIIRGGQDDSSLSSRSDFGYHHTSNDFGYNRMSLETQSTLT
mmetsp:Transcript_13584/g.31855  ORF Transcript_13584/g.31855 Transcript_13584/m.31855 type:complete len:362 (+) Transcript_13584:63-1148(+)